VIQPVLPLHGCAAEPLQDAAESVADPTAAKAAVHPNAIESIAKPLYSIADSTGSDAALTERFYLFIWI
jgi:hypothetical protein